MKRESIVPATTADLALLDALDVIAPPYAIVDVDGRVLHASKSLLALVSPRADAVGRKLVDLLSNEAAIEIRSALAKSRELKQSVTCSALPIDLPSGPGWMRPTVQRFGKELPNFSGSAWILDLAVSAPLSGSLDQDSDERGPEEHAHDLPADWRHARSEWQRIIKELEHANASLRDSEGRARALVEASAQMVWTTNGEGKVVEDSPSWREFTGQTFEQWKDVGWLDVLHPDDQQKTLVSWERSVATGEPYEVVYRVRRADGQWRWTAARAVPQRDAAGRVLRWVGMNTDVTDRKEIEAREDRLQRKLRAKERRLRMALQSARMAAWEWSADKSIWDERLYEILGIPTDTPASTPTFFQAVHPDDLPGLKAAWERATSGKGSYDHEFRIIRPDGEVRWLAGFGEFILNERGDVTRVYGLNWDITEKKAAEQQERRQQELDGLLSQAAAVLASSLDCEVALSKVAALCVPILADGVCIDLFDAEGNTKRVAETFADPVRHACSTAVQGLFSQSAGNREFPSGKPSNPSAVIVRHYLKEDLQGGATLLEPGATTGGLAATELVTASLAARDTLFGTLNLLAFDSTRVFSPSDVRFAGELAARVAVAIDNARLFQAAQLASASKSRFLASMSHEIRTPMTSILGYAELLAQQEVDPTRLDFLKTIQRNGQFLLEIINDILDLSKIEAGRFEILRSSGDPRAVVEDVCSMMQVRAQEKRLTLDVEVAGDVPPRVTTDQLRLRQILVNLVGNAVKFTSEGGVQVAVRYQREAQPPLLCIDVVDSGIGLTHEAQRNLFEPFSQGDSTIAKEFGGTGLGLAISQRLAKMLGGEITVSSQLGKGAKFRCTIAAPPCDQSGATTDENLPDAALRDSDASSAGLACRVLVVDDRRDIHLLTKQFLTRAGAAVRCLENGLEAIQLLTQSEGDEGDFDVILLDMQMPLMDGYATAKRLRREGYRKPIIALTADAMDGDKARCLEVGCDAYLSKPIDATALLELVGHYSTQDRSAEG